MLSFFPRGVLDEILNLIESVSEGFPSYSFIYSVLVQKDDSMDIPQNSCFATFGSSVLTFDLNRKVCAKKCFT